jgi:hypothetical protein
MEYVELRVFYRKKQFLMQSYFVKYFIIFKAHLLKREQEVFFKKIEPKPLD